MEKCFDWINANRLKFISICIFVILADQILLQYFRQSPAMENIVVAVSSIAFGGVIFFIFKLWFLFIKKFECFFIKTPKFGKCFSYSMTVIFLIAFFFCFFFTWFSDEPLYGFCYIIVWIILLLANYYKITESG
jgi:hypothetical protein